MPPKPDCYECFAQRVFGLQQTQAQKESLRNMLTQPPTDQEIAQIRVLNALTLHLLTSHRPPQTTISIKGPR